MSDYFAGALAALGAGVLTSVHPCPLATNLAAASILCVWADSLRRTIAVGISYVLGRLLVYVCLGMLLLFGVLSVPRIANALQQLADKLLGPCLIVVGMAFCGLIRTRKKHGSDVAARTAPLPVQRRVPRSFLLGVVLALSFCPVSAGMFFGVLIPLAIRQRSPILYPTAYALGTGLPVIAMVLVATTGITAIQRKLTDRPDTAQWAQQGAGGLLVAIGIFYTLEHVYHLF